MPAIFVLDVPEFAGLVAYAQRQPNVEVRPVRGCYIEIRAADELVFDRRAAGFKPAVWYSTLSGGVIGHVAELGRDTMRIVGSKTR